MDCEGDIGWVPASFIKPLNDGDNDDDGDRIVTDSFIAGKGKNFIILAEANKVKETTN